MARSTDMFNDKYTYLDLHLMFESAVERAQDAIEIGHGFEELTDAECLALTEAYYEVEREFYDKYGWIDEFYDECDNLVCLGNDIVCDKDCDNCPCAHPVEEFL